MIFLAGKIMASKSSSNGSKRADRGRKMDDEPRKRARRSNDSEGEKPEKEFDEPQDVQISAPMFIPPHDAVVCVHLADVSQLHGILRVMEKVLQECPISFIKAGAAIESPSPTLTDDIVDTLSIPAAPMPFTGLAFTCVSPGSHCYFIARHSASVYMDPSATWEDTHIVVGMELFAKNIALINGACAAKIFRKKGDPKLYIYVDRPAASIRFELPGLVEGNDTIEFVRGMEMRYTVEIDKDALRDIAKAATANAIKWVRIDLWVDNTNPNKSYILFRLCGDGASFEFVFYSDSVCQIGSQADCRSFVAAQIGNEQHVALKDVHNVYREAFDIDYIRGFVNGVPSQTIILRMSPDYPLVLTSYCGDGQESFTSQVIGAQLKDEDADVGCSHFQ